MGVQEFSTSLAQFNQEQLDDIQATAQLIQAAVQAIQNTDIAALNNKVGTSADGTAVLTLFGKLAKIINDTSGLAGWIGTNNDASGIGTLFGQIRYAHNLLGGPGSVLAKIGSWGDPAAVGSLYAGQTYISDRIAEVNAKIGWDTDTQGIGSLYGRFDGVHYSIDRLTINNFQNANFLNTSASNAWYTIASVSGRGILNRVMGYHSNTATNIEFSIEIDFVVTNFSVNLARGNGNIAEVIVNATFDTRMVVQIRNAGATGPNLSGAVDYGLL